jgi:TetR/AcrR family transcriptional regulator
MKKTKQQIIIDAARDRFAHFGFSKVTMDEIASDVELGKASLYYYFPTKEELFKAVITLEQNELKNDIELILQAKKPASQKLHEYVKLRMKFFQDLINLGTLSIYSYFDSKSVYEKLFLDFEKIELVLIKKIIGEGIHSKEFDPDLSDETAVVFLHILQGLRCRILRKTKSNLLAKKIHNDLQKEMTTATEIFINGIKCT